MNRVDPDSVLESRYEGSSGESKLYYEPILGLVDIDLSSSDTRELTINIDSEQFIANTTIRGQNFSRHQTHSHPLINHFVPQNISSQGDRRGCIGRVLLATSDDSAYVVH